MSSGDLGYPETNDNEAEFVPAVFARDAEEARQYCELLSDHGIVGIVANDGIETEDAEVRGSDGEVIGITRGVAVLVEETMLDEAGLVIADRQDLAEFQFDDDESEDDEDELNFAQGIDSEFDDDDAKIDKMDAFSVDHGGFDDDFGEDEEIDDDDDLNDEFDEY